MKIKVIYFIAIILFIYSCKTQKSSENESTGIEGIFSDRRDTMGFKYQYILELNQGGSFFFKIITQDAMPQCRGKWRIENNKFIILDCHEASVWETLTNGYMNSCDYKIKILNKNKLKYKNVILKRKNSTVGRLWTKK